MPSKLPKQLTLERHEVAAASLTQIEVRLEELKTAITLGYGLAFAHHKQWVAANWEIFELRELLESLLVNEHHLGPWHTPKLYMQ